MIQHRCVICISLSTNCDYPFALVLHIVQVRVQVREFSPTTVPDSFWFVIRGSWWTSERQRWIGSMRHGCRCCDINIANDADSRQPLSPIPPATIKLCLHRHIYAAGRGFLVPFVMPSSHCQRRCALAVWIWRNTTFTLRERSDCSDHITM